jgi:hypothetical protein
MSEYIFISAENSFTDLPEEECKVFLMLSFELKPDNTVSTRLPESSKKVLIDGGYIRELGDGLFFVNPHYMVRSEDLADDLIKLWVRK